MANKKRKGRTQLAVSEASADTASIRTETFMGRDYTVVPVVALVQGVLQSANSLQPELALAAEFGKVPASWDGRPVVLNHPQIDDEFVSANSPSVLETYQFGFLFNTQLKDGKLLSEAWIDSARVSELGGIFQETVDRINSGEIVEVSTGLFTSSFDTPGVYEGKTYKAVWREIVPDHFAILTEGKIGACSVEDGCGTPRANAASSANLVVEATIVNNEVTTNCACEPKTNKQPEALEARVRRLLANSYPSGMTNRDAYTLLSRAVREMHGRYTYVVMFTQDNVVYEMYNMDDYSYSVWQSPYTIADSTKVTFTGEPVEVNVLTRIEPVQKSEGHNMTTNTTTTVAANSGTPQNPTPSPANPVPLNPTPNAPAQPANPNPTPTPSSVTTNSSLNPPAANEGAAASTSLPVGTQAAATPPKVLSVAEYVAAAPPEVQEALNEGIRASNEKRNALIADIKASKRSDFSDAELIGMPLQLLQRMAKLANAPSFEGQGLPNNNGTTFGANAADQRDTGPVPAPLLVFERKTA